MNNEIIKEINDNRIMLRLLEFHKLCRCIEQKDDVLGEIQLKLYSMDKDYRSMIVDLAECLVGSKSCVNDSNLFYKYM